MNYSVIFSIAFVITLISSCHKKAIVLHHNHCLYEQTAPPKNIPGYEGYNPTGEPCIAQTIVNFLSEYSYSRPTFNPNNKNEIIYLEIKERTQHKDRSNTLWKYNFCTHEKTVVAKDIIPGCIDWGAQNWIAFTGIDFQIYKVKPSGDSLTRIVGGLLESWNTEGTEILYTNSAGIFIANENGLVVDTLLDVSKPRPSYLNGYKIFCWAGDSLFVNKRDSIIIYDFKSKKTVDKILKPYISYSFNHSTAFQMLPMLKSGKLLCYAENTVVEFDLKTHDASLVFDYLGDDEKGQIIDQMDISSDEKHLVFSKVNIRKYSETNVEVEFFIHLLDTDWKNDRRVLITK